MRRTGSATRRPILTCLADDEAVAAFDRAHFRRLLADEKQRIVAAEVAFWAQTDATYPSVEARAIVWDICRGKCAYCGRVMNPFRDFTVDHRTPRTRGGEDEIGNLVGCCRSCNARKATRTEEEWDPGGAP